MKKIDWGDNESDVDSVEQIEKMQSTETNHDKREHLNEMVRNQQ